jgi:hypothetical protein
MLLEAILCGRRIHHDVSNRIEIIRRAKKPNMPRIGRKFKVVLTALDFACVAPKGPILNQAGDLAFTFLPAQ